MKKFAASIIVIVIISTIGWWFFLRPQRVIVDTSADTAVSTPSGPDVARSLVAEPITPDISTETGKGLSELQSEALSASKEPFVREYMNKDFHMSFRYPADFVVRTDDVSNSIFVLTSPQSAIGLQVEVSPFDDKDQTITESRIEKDVPEMTITGTQNILMGGTSRGVAFLSVEGAQNTREVWFAHGGLLYQISAPQEYDPFVKSVIDTWKFI